MPIQNSVRRLPNRSLGMPPRRAPRTVPHRAIDMMKSPWKSGLVSQSIWMGRSAPEMTIVSKPNKKPASAAMNVLR